MELPPRARRIPNNVTVMLLVVGTTSACAENTMVGVVSTILGWNYLRVRGEYPRGLQTPLLKQELPPRARRIRLGFGGALLRGGTTSACAENTPDKPGVSRPYRNYLRVRGEYA